MVAFKIWDALPALIVASAGVGLAWLWYNLAWWSPIPILIAALAVGLLVDGVARRTLLPEQPVAAAWLMESWLLVPCCLGSLVAGLMILAAVSFEPAKDASAEASKMLAAALGGLSAFAAATVLKAFDDADEGLVGTHVRGAFLDAYPREEPGKPRHGHTHPFAAGSEGELWVQSFDVGGISGWGRAARLARARGVQQAIKGV